MAESMIDLDRHDRIKRNGPLYRGVPFSFRSRSKVEAMGRLAYSQHARMENSPQWGRSACSLLDPAERALWEESWDKANSEHQKEKS